MITVRPAIMADASAMSAVLIASITVLCAADHGNEPARIAHWTRNKSPEGVRAMFGNPKLSLFVAEHDGALAAVGGTTGDTIALNYTSPAYRFVGAGKALMARMEAELKRAGYPIGRLSSSATAHRFYERCGWVDAGEPGHDYSVAGYPMTKIL
jgi:GNAT superfamily N-acetyltransferase